MNNMTRRNRLEKIFDELLKAFDSDNMELIRTIRERNELNEVTK